MLLFVADTLLYELLNLNLDIEVETKTESRILYMWKDHLFFLFLRHT